MNDKIKIFLKNEKEISEFKINLFESSGDKGYKHRLIKLEKEFLGFPFEKLPLSSIDEAREATSLFRANRASFNKKYNIISEEEFDQDISLSILDRKFSFYDNKYRQIVESEIQENFGETKYFNNRNSKARARYQVLVCALARNIYVELKKIRHLLDGDIDRKKIGAARSLLDSLADRAFLDAFRHYNDSIEHSYLISQNTPGYNKHIASVYPLSNLTDRYSSDLFVKRVLPKDGKFLDDAGGAIEKNYVRRGISIVTPINRVGNEKMELLYREVYTEFGVCIDDILERDFYNCKIGKEYYKAIPTMPIWNLINKRPTKHMRLVKEIIGISVDIETGSPSGEFIEMINSIDPLVKIDRQKSLLLIAGTRSELEKINKAKNAVELLIKNLKEEYSNIFYSFKKSKENTDRKKKIENIIGSILDEWNQ